MTRIQLGTFKAMYEDFNLSNLYHRLIPVSKVEPGGQGDSRVVVIDDDRVQGEAFRIAFREWVAANRDKVLPMAQPSYPELDALQPQDAPLEPAKPKAPQSREAIEATQQRYLTYWVGHQGLLNNPENAAVIDAWFAAHEPGYTAEGLDRAIENNRAALAWYVAPTVEYIEGTREVDFHLGLARRQSTP